MGFSFRSYRFVNLVFWLLLLFHPTLAHFTSSEHLLCHDDERSALLQFKESLTIDETIHSYPSAYAKVESWKVQEGNDDCCTWDGIKCNEDTGHVVRLNLTSSYLYGSINSSSSLFQLVHLEWLSLADNDFNYSKIPSAIMNLSRLTHLDLSYSDFSGQIASGMVPSSLGNLTHLSYLDLSYNAFSGELPTSIGSLGSLEKLDISDNFFSSQNISSLSWIVNLTKLTYLDLSANDFSSQNISSLSWIVNLTKLTNLDLSSINLVGDIPIWLSNLVQLRFLGLGGNELTGAIPDWLMNLNKLEVVYLDDNQLTGQIPFEIRNLTQLTTLNLRSNRLEGPIPSSVFELTNLVKLDLSLNNLSGTLNLDMFLPHLKSLEVLVLSSNNLSLLTETTVYTSSQNFGIIGLRSCNLRAFPNFLQKQQQLVTLDLSSNKIAGQIPRWLSSVGILSLDYLNLSYNLLTGFDQHPVVLPWIELVTLDIRSNKLHGPLPFPQVSIFTYLVSDNQLTGTIPLSICSLKGLHALDLSNNNLSDKLPQCLGNFSNDLSVLKLQGNRFHGSIPQIFMKGSNLRMVDLSHNLLHGRMPRTLANCVKLQFINLGSNQINDTFPSWLGTLPNLKVLILRRNNFHGVIKEPKTDVGFPELRIIDLSHNEFMGNLPSKYFRDWNAMKVVNASQLIYMQDELFPEYFPPYTFYGPFDYSLTISSKGIDMEYGKLSNLVTGILLSNNKFEGEIPTLIGSLKGLRYLNFSNNYLQGGIPSSLANLTVLESLDLSNNNLSGEIPENLVELTSLEYFNVSHNHLTGRIPQGKQFNTFENSSFDGNSGLCGKPLLRECEIPEASQKGDQGSSSPYVFGWKVVVMGYVSGLIIGMVIGHMFATRKHEWFAKTFGWQLKLNAKRKTK